MGGLTYAVKVTLHPEQSPSAPRAADSLARGTRAAGHSVLGARNPVGPAIAAAAAAAAAAAKPDRPDRDRTQTCWHLAT